MEENKNHTLRCFRCKYSKEEGYRLWCEHPFCTGVVATDDRMRWRGFPEKWGYVSGCEWCGRCSSFQEVTI